MVITPLPPERLEAMVDFISRLNDDPTHHIAFYGSGRDEITESIREVTRPPEESFLLADDGGRLVGVMGVDFDPAVGQAWMLGPLVDADDWHGVADALYVAALPQLPAGLSVWLLFGDAENLRLADFARRHGYQPHSRDAILTLRRPETMPDDLPIAAAFDPVFSDAFDRLHEALFPRTYFTARQLIELDGPDQRLMFVIEGDDLIGYAFYRIQSAARQSYLDFIGVAEAARGRGVGRRLLADVVRGSFAEPAVERLNLTVRSENTAAMRLYEAMGFVVERVTSSYRRSFE